MRVSTGSRLHFGLIDLNGELGRVDGGIGLSIKQPSVEIEAELSDEVDVSGPMNARAINAIESVLNEINGDPIKAEIISSIPQHVGLGSGTQIALSAALLTSKLNGEDIYPKRLASIVNRGGTSGIGTAAFSEGGFILDGGHKLSNKKGYLPSSASNVPPPPVLARLEFPDWDIRVFLPDGKGAFGSDELQTFQEVCPIPGDEVMELSRIILMKLMPSIVESDFTAFREGIIQVQKTGFKKDEIERQPASKRIIHKLWDQGYAAGLSSLGPAVYAISPDYVDESTVDVKSFQTEANQTGAEVFDQ